MNTLLGQVVLCLVQSMVVASKHHLQVLNTIISAVLVYVVNMLIASQRAAQVALHDVPMLHHLYVANPYPSIPTGINMPSTSGSIMTRMRAKPSGCLSVLGHDEYTTAPVTGLLNASVSAIQGTVFRTLYAGRVYSKGDIASCANDVWGRISLCHEVSPNQTFCGAMPRSVRALPGLCLPSIIPQLAIRKDEANEP